MCAFWQVTPLNPVDTMVQLPSTVPMEQTMTLWEMLLKGGWLMIPIVLCSLLAVFVILERWLVLRRARMEVQPFLRQIQALLQAGDVAQAIAVCEEVDRPIARMLRRGLERLGRPIEDIEEAIQQAGKQEAFALERRLDLLASISGIAPLLGFLGTVTGMIEAFQQIQALQGNVNPSVLAGGIWEALITTAAGLAVGIPAYAFYNYLNSRVNRMVFELEEAATRFLDLLEEPVRPPSARPV